MSNITPEPDPIFFEPVPRCPECTRAIRIVQVATADILTRPMLNRHGPRGLCPTCFFLEDELRAS